MQMLLNGRKQVNLTCTGYLSCERKRKSLLKLYHEKLTGDRAISCYRDDFVQAFTGWNDSGLIKTHLQLSENLIKKRPQSVFD